MIPEAPAKTAAAAAAVAAEPPKHDNATKPTTPSKPKAKATHRRVLPTQKKEKKRVAPTLVAPTPTLVAPTQPPRFSEKSPRTKAAEAADRVQQGLLKYGDAFEKEAAKLYQDPSEDEKQPPDLTTAAGDALAADDDAVAGANALMELNPMELKPFEDESGKLDPGKGFSTDSEDDEDIARKVPATVVVPAPPSGLNVPTTKTKTATKKTKKKRAGSGKSRTLLSLRAKNGHHRLPAPPKEVLQEKDDDSRTTMGGELEDPVNEEELGGVLEVPVEDNEEELLEEDEDEEEENLDASSYEASDEECLPATDYDDDEEEEEEEEVPTRKSKRNKNTPKTPKNTPKLRRNKKRRVNKDADEDSLMASSSSSSGEEDETPKKHSKKELAATKKAAAIKKESPKRANRSGLKKYKKYKSKKYSDRPKTIADRLAGSPPLSVKQQMDSMIREKVKALKKPMDTLHAMSTPFARTDAYDSDDSDTTLVTNEKRYPWVIFGGFCMTHQKTNPVGTCHGGAFLKKPRMIFWAGSERATAQLKEDIDSGKAEIMYCSSNKEFIDTLRSDSAKAAPAPPKSEVVETAYNAFI